MTVDPRDQYPGFYPPGYKPGCLVRASRPGQWFSLASEQIDVIPSGDWAELIEHPDKPDMRPLVKKIKNQGSVGSCATESTAQSIEIVRALAGYDWVELSPWSIYWYTSGGADRGSSIDENLRYVASNGVAPMSLWPRSKGWRSRPSDEALEAAKGYRIEEWYDATTIAEVGTALLLGWPVVFGWRGHSCVLTSLKTPSVAVYANSWSVNWGDQGFGTIRLSEIDFRYGAYITRVPTGPTE